MANHSPEPTKLDERLADAIVQKTAETVRDHYIFVEDARKMSALLLLKQRQGAFTDAETVPELAKLLNEELMTVREDLHLAVLPWDGGAEDGGMHDTGS